MAELVVSIDGAEYNPFESLDNAPDSVFFEAINYIAALRNILRKKPLGHGFDEEDNFVQGDIKDIFDSATNPDSNFNSELEAPSKTTYCSVISLDSRETIATTVADDNLVDAIMQAVPSPRFALLNAIMDLAIKVKRGDLDAVLERIGVSIHVQVLECLRKRCLCTCAEGSEYTNCITCSRNVCECCSFDLRDCCIDQNHAEIGTPNEPPQSQNLVSRRILAFCSEDCSDTIGHGSGVCQCEAHIVETSTERNLGVHCLTCLRSLLDMTTAGNCLHIRSGPYDEPTVYRCFCGKPANLSIKPWCSICGNKCSVPTTTDSRYFVPFKKPRSVLSRYGSIEVL